MNTPTISCRSEEGITIGLIDSIITSCRLLVRRDLSHPEVKEALKDLVQDEDLKVILTLANEYNTSC